MGRGRVAGVALAALGMAACLVVLAMKMREKSTGGEDELLLKVDLESHDPYSAPANLYLWWGPSTNHRFTGSGEHIRHLLHMGIIEGGEWRDPMFLGNNGVATFRSQRFRKISETCCSTIVIPPMEWDFPVYNTHKMIGQRIRNYVANGNMLVLTGGILSIEFINSYFFYTIEPADGDYSPGPYRRLEDVPDCMRVAPEVLPQKGISVTAVKKDSLPSGTEVLWGTPRSSPVFMIKFCEAQSPSEGMPPVKVLPRDCPLAEKDGRPCSCGYIMYIGYNYQEQYPTRWDKVLRGAVEIMNPVWQEPQGGLKGNKKVVIPGTPPCLQKGEKKYDWPNTGAYSKDMKDLDDVSLKHADQGNSEHSQASARGRDATDKATLAMQKVSGKLTQEKQEIDHLQTQVERLKHVHPQPQPVQRYSRTQVLSTQGAAESEPSMSQLRQKAMKILQEVKQKERQQQTAPIQQARSSTPAGESAETRTLVKVVTSLAKDVSKVCRRRRRRRRRGRGERGAMDRGLTMIQINRKVDKLADSEKKPVQVVQAAPSDKEEKQIKTMQKEMEKYKKKAHSLEQELNYEQSVPMPEYTQAEQDHTTPLFAHGARSCGTLCKLKKLVKKTRQNISKVVAAPLIVRVLTPAQELEAALH
eukprot:761634-Hanusia_phi.AAC.4